MKPILFNTEMVRAILDGRKTVTRRLVKPQPDRAHTILDYDEATNKFELLCGNGGEGGIFLDWSEWAKAPYRPGDILYVRETWNFGYIETSDAERCFDSWFETWDWRTRDQHPYLNVFSRFWYKADNDDFGDVDMEWRPSIHMPKEAARIFLRVTDVWLQRLQEIKNEECVAEGAVKKPNYTKRGDLVFHNRYRQEFSELWNTTIKPGYFDRYCWNANPWVWVIEFERCEKPEEVNKC